MIYFFLKIFKLLFFLFLSIPSFLNANFIRDTEIENVIYSWANPIFNAAEISENTIKINIGNKI